MSTEIPPTEPANPVVPAPKGGPVKPDNWYNDSTTEAPADGLLAGNPAKRPVKPGQVKPGQVKPGQVKPDNWYNDSEPTA